MHGFSKNEQGPVFPIVSSFLPSPSPFFKTLRPEIFLCIFNDTS